MQESVPRAPIRPKRPAARPQAESAPLAEDICDRIASSMDPQLAEPNVACAPLEFSDQPVRERRRAPETQDRLFVDGRAAVPPGCHGSAPPRRGDIRVQPPRSLSARSRPPP